MAAKTLSGIFAVVLLGTLFMPVAAEAGLLDSTLSWQYYAGGGMYNPDTGGSVTYGSFVDDGGYGGTFIEPGPLTVFDIDADDTSITFDYSDLYTTESSWSSGSPLSLAPTIYNGIAINLASPGSFADVTIDSATNTTNASDVVVFPDISFTDNQIQVDWSGLYYNTDTIVKLDVTFESQGAPEPGTYSLMAVALLISCLVWRRKLDSRPSAD